MSDGGYHKARNSVRIFTYNFTHTDCLRLAESITNIGIRTSVILDRTSKKGNNQYILTIGALQLEALRGLVLPHMHKTMYYRVGM